MAGLVERLMGEGVPSEEHIPVHDFFAVVLEVVAGKLTGTQVKNFYAMDSAAIADWDALAALVPGTDAGKALYIERVHGVFILAEGRYPTYNTPANVRTKLGI